MTRPQDIAPVGLASKISPARGVRNLTALGVAIDIDRQRIAAVRALEALGFSYRNGTWLPPVAAPSQTLPLLAEAAAMHAALVRRADALAGCTEGLKEEKELEAIANVLDAYEAKCWPDGCDRSS